MKFRIYIVASLIAVFFLSGSALAGKKYVTTELDKAPAVVQGVVAAAVHGILPGDTVVKKGKFSGAPDKLINDKFDYAGFRLTGCALLDSKKSADGNTLEGMLQFKDAFDRSCSVAFKSGYKANGDVAEIKSMKAGLVAPEQPRVKIFWVPADVVKGADKAVFAKWDSLYEFVSKNDKTTKMATKALMYGFVFCMDRIAPDAKFDVIVSLRKREKSASKNIAKTQYANYNGWRVGIVAGTVKLGSLRTKFFLNAVYTPGTPTPDDDRDKEIILNFASNKL